ncbi:MAG: hypothetical protein ACEQR8_00360 [Cypionkella sp.]
MRKFLIGAAAIALAAGGALAEPGGKGGGSGHGKGGGPDHAAMSHGEGKADKGASGGPGRPERGPDKRAERGSDIRAERAERGPDNREQARQERRAVHSDERREDGERGERGATRQAGKSERAIERREERATREAERRVVRDVRNDREPRLRGDDGRIARTDWFAEGSERFGLIDGCPPGLAGKNNGCLPPGLARQRDRDWGQRYHQPAWWGYDRAGAGRYFYEDGYLYRLGGDDSVLGYIPLLGGALSVGNPWPSTYEPYPVPQYYRDYYNLGPVDSYRYADDVLYRVDPQSGVIESIAALLTGDRFAVGEPLPAGYDVYNVPYGYQDQYYDTPDARYRYADGYVYEVDPTTQLVTAVIELLA